MRTDTPNAPTLVAPRSCLPCSLSPYDANAAMRSLQVWHRGNTSSQPLYSTLLYSTLLYSTLLYSTLPAPKCVRPQTAPCTICQHRAPLVSTVHHLSTRCTPGHWSKSESRGGARDTASSGGAPMGLESEKVSTLREASCRSGSTSPSTPPMQRARRLRVWREGGGAGATDRRERAEDVSASGLRAGRRQRMARVGKRRQGAALAYAVAWRMLLRMARRQRRMSRVELVSACHVASSCQV